MHNDLMLYEKDETLDATDIYQDCRFVINSLYKIIKVESTITTDYQAKTLLNAKDP